MVTLKKMTGETPEVHSDKGNQEKKDRIIDIIDIMELIDIRDFIDNMDLIDLIDIMDLILVTICIGHGVYKGAKC